MAPLFRRHSNVHCFYCNSPVHTVRNTTNFRCSACGCWNRYNGNGEIISDEPAMHQEDLNRVAFSKRASFSQDQLPNLSRNHPFCHNCQTNQMLIMNLLSNYLPPPESPEYQQRVRMLPNYKESLYSRYPPVCDSCRPAVEEEIQNKEQMARRKALNGWLQGGKERQRKSSGTPVAKEKKILKTIHWRIRGALWFASSFASISSLLLAMAGRSIVPHIHSFLLYSLPLLVFISLLWTAWDPTYILLHKAQLHNRDVRLNGKRDYIICQMLAWLSRLVFSIVILLDKTKPESVPGLLRHPYIYIPIALLTESIALVASPLFLRIHHPPPIRLIDTHAHLAGPSGPSRAATPATSTGSKSQSSTPIATTFPKLAEQDLLASLSLSSQPIITPSPKTNPVFGLPSFGASTSTSHQHHVSPKIEEDDAMDWSPINEDGKASRNHRPNNADEGSSWLRPQRFFAPEKPTGLENLFARTRLDDSDLMQIDQDPSSFSSWRSWLIPVMIAVLALSAAFLAFHVVKWKDSSIHDVYASQQEL